MALMVGFAAGVIGIGVWEISSKVRFEAGW